MYMLEGVSRVAYEESRLNQDSHFLICSVRFVHFPARSVPMSSKRRKLIT